jgi:excisionase family DNA binding protein
MMASPLRGQQRNSWSESPPASRTDATRSQTLGRAPALHGAGGARPPAELIAHLVLALSKYLRQLRTEGGRAPAEVEALIIFLTDPARALHDATLLDGWRAAYDPSATPRRLLITKSDAAEVLGVSLRTIERLISAGRLPLVHVEGAARVRLTDLEAYVQSLEADANPGPPADKP